jgi:hypothetical protein
MANNEVTAELVGTPLPKDSAIPVYISVRLGKDIISGAGANSLPASKSKSLLSSFRKICATMRAGTRIESMPDAKKVTSVDKDHKNGTLLRSDIRAKPILLVLQKII